MPKKTPAPGHGSSLRSRIAELNHQLQQAQAVADADRRIAEVAKAEAKRTRKAHKQARKIAKASKKEVKALRREIEALVAEGGAEAKPKHQSTKRAAKKNGTRPKIPKGASSAEGAAKDSSEFATATPPAVTADVTR